jgi:hypothetical protein
MKPTGIILGWRMLWYLISTLADLGVMSTIGTITWSSFMRLLTIYGLCNQQRALVTRNNNQGCNVRSLFPVTSGLLLATRHNHPYWESKVPPFIHSESTYDIFIHVESSYEFIGPMRVEVVHEQELVLANRLLIIILGFLPNSRCKH